MTHMMLDRGALVASILFNAAMFFIMRFAMSVERAGLCPVIGTAVRVATQIEQIRNEVYLQIRDDASTAFVRL